MSDPAREGGSRCAVCGQPSGALKSEFNLELYNAQSDSVDLYFCSWAHVAEWIGRGEPDFRALQEPETWGDRVFAAAFLAFGLVLMALIGIGARTVVHGLF